MTLRGGLLILGALLAALGVCLLLLGDEEQGPTPDTQDEAARAEEEREAPMLVGSGHEDGDGPEKREGASTEARKAASAFRAPKMRRVQVRLRGKDGITVRIPRIIVETVSGEGPNMRRGVDVGADGTITFEVDASAPLRELRLIAQSTEGPRFEKVVHEWKSEDGGQPGDADIELESTYLKVRTVDSRGDPRPHQRILMRYVVTQGNPNGSWWGESSNEQGELWYGPYKPGTMLEFRPGWRGVKKEDLTREMLAWRRAVVGDATFDLFVGDQPRLVVEFTGVKEGAILPIEILHRETGKPVLPGGTYFMKGDGWRAPALQDGIPLEIVVGPTSKGFFARQTLDALTHYPVAMHLVAVPKTAGEIQGPHGERVRRGSIQAVGRGFVVERHFTGGGRFEFPGLPAERITYVVKAEIENRDGTTTWLTGEHIEEAATWLTIRLPAPKKRNKPALGSAR